MRGLDSDFILSYSENFACLEFVGMFEQFWKISTILSSSYTSILVSLSPTADTSIKNTLELLSPLLFNSLSYFLFSLLHSGSFTLMTISFH